MTVPKGSIEAAWKKYREGCLAVRASKSDFTAGFEAALSTLPIAGEGKVEWESPEEWEIEQRAFQAVSGRSDVPADVQQLVAKLWAMYCHAAVPSSPGKDGGQEVEAVVWSERENAFTDFWEQCPKLVDASDVGKARQAFMAGMDAASFFDGPATNAAIDAVANFLKERDEAVLPDEIDDDEREASARCILRVIGKASSQPASTALVESDPTDEFLAQVAKELKRARAKFPGDRIMTIALAEEFGELAKAMLDENGEAVWKEAVQTAVMAARVAIDGDSSVDEWRAAKGLDNHRLAGRSALSASTSREGER